MTELDELRRRLDYPDGHLPRLDPAAIVRAARRTQVRRRSAVAATVLVVSLVAGVAAATGSFTASGPAYLDPSPAPTAPAAGKQEMTPSTGYVTKEQAARAGLDGRAACEARDPLATSGAQVAGQPELLGGYLTDTGGMQAWRREFDGGSITMSSPPPVAYAICWYRGAFTTDSQAEADGQLEAPWVQLDFPLVESQFGGMGSRISKFPIAILAPPLPDRALLPDELKGAVSYVAPQPEGVQLLDGDTPPTPHPRPTPAADAIVGDCVPYACPDASEVPVRVDVTVNGRPVRATDVVPVRAGETLDVVVVVTAPQQAELTGLRIGATSQGSRFDEVLAESAQQGAGAREYRLAWQVPGPAAQPRGLGIEYSATSPLHGDRAMTHGRSLVQLEVS